MTKKKRRFALGSRYKRLLIVSLGLFFLFSLLVLQFYQLQVVEEKKWKKIAKSQHETIVTEPAQRGIFYSNVNLRSNHPEDRVAFVIDVPKYHLHIDSLMVPTHLKDEIADKIITLLPRHKLDPHKVKQDCYKKSRSRKIASWLTREEKKELDHWWRPFARKHKIASNAIYYIKDFRRSYPFGKLLGQVLHTVRDEKDPKTGCFVPTGGLELYLDEQIKGINGKRILQRTLKHTIETDRVLTQPKDGADVYLTINHHLQAIAEEEIEKGVKKVGAKAGWAVMMNPHNGEIYCMAQYPFFDPMKYSQYYNDENMLEHTKIKAICDCFEPGSTFKAITASLGLLANEELRKRNEKPLFDPDEMIPTLDGTLPGRKPMRDGRAHKYLNMDLAIQKSSNIYMCRLVERILDRLGADWYRQKLEEVYGIGTLSGIEFPYENIGLLPTPGAKYPSGHLQWTVPTPFSLAIGYNVLTNTMQMLRAIAVIANGGYKVRPHLIQSIRKKDSNELISAPEMIHERVMDLAIVERVKRSMKFVIKKGGLAPYADVNGYTVAGKTSTSEKIKNGVYSKIHNFSTFIGFTPVSDPVFILMVCIDEPEVKNIQGFGMSQYGGKCAAPVFSEIARKSLEYLGVAYDDPYGFPLGDPRSDPEKADWSKETKELLQRYKQWNEK